MGLEIQRPQKVLAAFLQLAKLLQHDAEYIPGVGVVRIARDRPTPRRLGLLEPAARRHIAVRSLWNRADASDAAQALVKYAMARSGLPRALVISPRRCSAPE